MAKYRKKPVVIEAVQLIQDGWLHNDTWPDWFRDAWNGGGGGEGAIWPDWDQVTSDPTLVTDLFIGTKEGIMRCPIGWWIIKGIAGELYACDPDIFEATYERVER